MKQLIVALTLLAALPYCKDKKSGKDDQSGNNTGPKQVIREVTASSTLSGKKNQYSALWLVDNDPATSWVEGKGDDGVRETVKFSFETDAALGSVKIVNGFGDPKYFSANNRVKEIGFSGSDGKEVVKTLMDNAERQELKFEPPLRGKVITLKIVSVYKGAKWRDTALSEVSFENAEAGSALATKISDQYRELTKDEAEGLYSGSESSFAVHFLHIMPHGGCEIVSYSHAAGSRQAESCTWERKGEDLIIGGKTYAFQNDSLQMHGSLTDDEKMKTGSGGPGLGEAYHREDVGREDPGTYMDTRGKKYIDSEGH